MGVFPDIIEDGMKHQRAVEVVLGRNQIAIEMLIFRNSMTHDLIIGHLGITGPHVIT